MKQNEQKKKELTEGDKPSLMNLFVDDKRNAPENFVIARYYEKAVKLMKENQLQVISLDYDLGGAETGLDVVDFFIENQLYSSEIYLHSSDLSARKKMFQTLQEAQKKGLINKNIKIFQHPFNQ